MKRQTLILLSIGIFLSVHAADWTGTWATATERSGDQDMPKTTTLSGNALRQTIEVSIGGSALRLLLSNTFSEEPVEIRSVYIADATEGSDINIKTARYLSFNGKKGVTISGGKTVWSDNLNYPLKPLQRLSITINYGSTPKNATGHRGSRTTSYIMSGESDPKKPFVTAETIERWYNIATLDVVTDSKTECIAVLGNSITDGRGSTTNQQNRWADVLSRRLLDNEPTKNVAVLNMGISGNCVLSGGLGPTASSRYRRDLLGQEGVKWINYLYDNNFGGCLADDMGLGKTLQTITMLTRVYPKQTESTLIIMPRSLLFNWQDELQKFAPQLTYYTYYGSQRDLAEATQQQLILTTYALVRNDIELFRQQQFHYIILDESQNIKNLQSQTTQAVLLLNGRHRLALSGTPIENNLTELYSLYRFLNPAMLGTLDDFNHQYAAPIQHGADKEATEALRRKIFPFMLRRLKKDVLTELPDRTEQTLYVEMETDHQRFYEERRRYYQEAIQKSIKAQGIEKSQMMMFQALSELRRIASVPESLSDGAILSPKIPLLCEQVEEAVAGGHKVVIFFYFIAGIELVGEHFTELGIDYATMTGSTHDRRAVIERFQQDAGCRALLMTLKTGGVGLNLTVADTVYIFEPWWNKAAEEQAINRLHRIGQKAKVMSYALITRDTIEEKIRLLQQQKQDLADSLITGDQAITKRLTEEDIKYIFGQ